MENYNQDPNFPDRENKRKMTVTDLHELSQRADSMVNKVASAINNISSTVQEIQKISAQVEIECAQLDHALDALIVKAQRDARIYEQSIPMLDKNFEKLQDRMDRLMDRAMDLIMEDISENALAKQEAIMTLIETTNGSLNALIQKLIPSY